MGLTCCDLEEGKTLCTLCENTCCVVTDEEYMSSKCTKICGELIGFKVYNDIIDEVRTDLKNSNINFKLECNDRVSIFYVRLGDSEKMDEILVQYD